MNEVLERMKKSGEEVPDFMTEGDILATGNNPEAAELFATMMKQETDENKRTRIENALRASPENRTPDDKKDITDALKQLNERIRTADEYRANLDKMGLTDTVVSALPEKLRPRFAAFLRGMAVRDPKNLQDLHEKIDEIVKKAWCVNAQRTVHNAETRLRDILQTMKSGARGDTIPSFDQILAFADRPTPDERAKAIQELFGNTRHPEAVKRTGFDVARLFSTHRIEERISADEIVKQAEIIIQARTEEKNVFRNMRLAFGTAKIQDEDFAAKIAEAVERDPKKVDKALKSGQEAVKPDIRESQNSPRLA